MNTIIGATFPIPKCYMGRFFEGGKTVFIKPATMFKNIEVGMKLVFYQSHEDTGYVGEAKIISIELSQDPFHFFEIYSDAIFLTQVEVKAYLEEQEKWKGVRVRKGRRKRRNWIALELEDIRKYDEIQKSKQFVPVGGRYLREYV